MKRDELYIRYLYKLHALHMKEENFTEAGFTLIYHSRMFDWSDDEIPAHSKQIARERYNNVKTQMEVKEALYNDIIKYFDEAKVRFFSIFKII